MKRNNKGFTLVELLASIIILGILMALSVPTILNMVDENENTMYVEAAKKLVAQAEYQMRANSSTIEKPEEDNAIAISLVYLDSSDFENAPNKGKYIKEASFVVIKNTGGNNLEYSVTLVEKMKKGGYKGIELTKSEFLEEKDAKRRVKIIKEEDIIFIEETEENEKGKILSSGIINNYLGDDYCSSIESIYNYPGLVDDVNNEKNNPPRITSISIKSTESINGFNANLTIVAEDDRTLRKKLKVYTSLVSYDDALSNSLGEDYGDADKYTKNITFPNSNGFDGNKFNVFVIVKDEAGNYDRAEADYTLHSNKTPVINKKTTFISKIPDAEKNMTKAKVNLDVTDDIDKTDDLLVCISTEATCTNYKKYSDYFKNHTMEYDFGGSLDGRVVKLNIFVRDSYGSQTSTSLEYEIYKNTAPKIKKVDIKSKEEKFIENVSTAGKSSSNGGHLTTNIILEASDDFAVEDLSVEISSKDPKTEELKTRQYNYKGSFEFTLPGVYDGTRREINITVKDKYGEKVSESYNYYVYKNKAPNIILSEKDEDGSDVVTTSVTSSEVICDDYGCPNCDGDDCSSEDNDCNLEEHYNCLETDGGSKEVNVRVKVDDDIDYSGNYQDLKVCFSNILEDCKDTNSNNFKSYSEYRERDNKFELKNLSDNPYDGSIKKFYFVVVDSLGLTTTKEIGYKLYENKSPIISNLKIESEPLELNSYNNETGSIYDFEDFFPININKAIVNFNAKDDIDFLEDLSVKVCIKNDKGEEKCPNIEEIRNISSDDSEEVEIDKFSFLLDFIKIFGEDSQNFKYNGQKYTISVELSDLYGKNVKKEIEYKLYEDKTPVIKEFLVQSKDLNYNSLDIEMSFYVLDPFDNYSVCIGPKSSYDDCLNNNPYYKEENIDGNDYRSSKERLPNKEITHNFSEDGVEYSEETPSQNIFINVKDSKGNTLSKKFEYYPHSICSGLYDGIDEEKDFNREYLSKENNKEINVTTCDGKCYFDDTNPIISYYNHKVSYIDLIQTNGKDNICNKEEINTFEDSDYFGSNTVERNCSFYKCFQKENENDYYMAVSTHSTDSSDYWSHIVDGKVHTHNTYHKIYDVTYNKFKDVVELKEKEIYGCPDLYNDNFYNPDNGYVLVDDNEYFVSSEGEAVES